MCTNRQLHVLGVSFRTAPLAVRETLAFDDCQAEALLREFATEAPGVECVVLSTCNRTEFYLVPLAAEDISEVLFRVLRKLRPHASILQSDCQRYELTGRCAAEHLFRVACGLESAVLGDVQIMTQIKQARNVSARAGSLGKYLTKTLDLAIAAGKQARLDTNISQGNASIGSAVAGMLCRRFRETSAAIAPRILIVGAGDVAASVARQLSKLRLGTICIVNRSIDRARGLARLCGGEAHEWSALPELLGTADVVVAATSAPEPVLSRVTLDEIARRRGGSEPLIVDAGMPRNVEQGTQLKVIDVDGIWERRDEILRARQTAVPAVELFIHKQLGVWEQWHQALPLDELVKSLYIELEYHQQHTIGELVNRHGLNHGEIRRSVIHPLRGILHQHVVRLRHLHSSSFQN